MGGMKIRTFFMGFCLLFTVVEPAFPADRKIIPITVKGMTAAVIESLLSIIRSFVQHIPYFVGAFIVLILTWVIAFLITQVAQRAMRRSNLRGSLQQLFKRFIAIGMWLFGFLLAAMIVFPGLTPSKAMGAMGLASIAVGLAFKDIFENFFAGILLLWRFPFEDGDIIECESLLGRVEKVALRMTKIRLLSGELIVCPNAFLFKNPVKVLTNRKWRRVSVTVGIAYGEDIRTAVELIEGTVKKCESVASHKRIQVTPAQFGSSSIDIEVYWWTQGLPESVRQSKGEVITLIKEALDTAGIEIPFPYRTLTFKDPIAVDSMVD